MKQRNGNVSNITKAGLNVLLVLGLMWGVAWLNILVHQHTTISETETLQKATRLNIALVNEDKPIDVGENSYQLGASYVKNIERDERHNWSVVSRGVAENGLAAGNYQLIIYIPSDFSSKILDIDNPVVEKAKVTYKISANRNLQVENEANQIAKDIVAELNSQLVDMYLVSILSNLYSAQKNVQSVAEKQGQNINRYEANLYRASQAFPTTLPNLVSISSGAVDSNNALISSLSNYTTFYSSWQERQVSFGTNLSALIEQRANEKVSYGRFMESLMSMESTVLSRETAQMIDQLTERQKQLTNALGQPAGAAGGQESTAYMKLVSDIDAHIHTLLTQMESSHAELKAKIDNVDAAAEELLKTQYPNQAALDDVTVKDILSNEGFSINSERYIGQMNQVMQSAVNRLPNLDASIYANKLNLAGQDQFAAITAYDATLANYYRAQYVPNTELDRRLNQAIATLNEKKTAATTAPVTKQSVDVSLVNQSQLPVTSWTIVNETTGVSETKGPGETAHIDLSHRIHFEFHFALPSTPTATPPTNSGSVRIMTVTGREVAATSNTIEADYRQAQGAYLSVVQEIVDSYNHTGQLLTSYYTGNQTVTDRFLNQSAKTYLVGVIKKSMVASLSSYQNSIDNDVVLANSINLLKENEGRLIADLAAIRTTNQELSNQVTEAITLVDDLKQHHASVRRLEDAFSQEARQLDGGLSNLDAQLNSLLATTQSIADTANDNTKQAESVNELFASFNRATEDAQASAVTLSVESDKLLGQFKEELGTTQNFAASFGKNFSHAYDNGVPNDVLLDFLSNPVTSEATTVQATVNAYRPFTWILLLEIVSLFTAYLFATHGLTKKGADPFRAGRWMRADVPNTVGLSLLSLAIGLAAGGVSGEQLQIAKEQVPSWIAVWVLFSFVLVHGQYFLLKQLKTVGMGLAFYTIISFVYLSSALGTTASLSGLPATLKFWNVLSILEQQLFAYFDGDTVGLGWIVLLLVVVFILIVGNIFITNIRLWTNLKNEGTDG